MGRSSLLWVSAVAMMLAHRLGSCPPAFPGGSLCRSPLAPPCQRVVSWFQVAAPSRCAAVSRLDLRFPDGTTGSVFACASCRPMRSSAHFSVRWGFPLTGELQDLCVFWTVVLQQTRVVETQGPAGVRPA